MALITSYSTLVSEVSNTIARTLTTDAPGLIQRWEERFLRSPKNFGRWMEIAFSTAMTGGVLAVHATYLGLKSAYINGSPSTPLVRVSLDQLYGRYPRGSDTGLPVWIAREAGNFVFGPEPDSTYTVAGVRWSKPTVLRSEAADAAGHYLIVNAPDLCLYGALAEAEAFLKNDKRIALWKGLYSEALADYRDIQREEDRSGSPSQEVLA